MCKEWHVRPTEYPDLDRRDQVFITAHWSEQQRRAERERKKQNRNLT